MELSSRNLANPTAMLLCSVAMLRHFGLVALASHYILICTNNSLQSHADAIETAIYNTISKTKVSESSIGPSNQVYIMQALTRDIGGDNTTSSFIQAVVANLP